MATDIIIKKNLDFHRDPYYIYPYKLCTQSLVSSAKKEIKPILICKIRCFHNVGAKVINILTNQNGCKSFLCFLLNF